MTPFCKKSAEVSHGILTLDVARSKVPGVVRVDLTAAPFSHFHVRSNDEGSVLGYSDNVGHFSPIALFADRSDADKGLAAIQSKLMRSSPGHILAKTALVFLALFIAILFLDWAFSHKPAPAQQAAMPGPSAGVPTDADSRFNSE